MVIVNIRRNTSVCTSYCNDFTQYTACDFRAVHASHSQINNLAPQHPVKDLEPPVWNRALYTTCDVIFFSSQRRLWCLTRAEGRNILNLYPVYVIQSQVAEWDHKTCKTNAYKCMNIKFLFHSPSVLSLRFFGQMLTSKLIPSSDVSWAEMFRGNGLMTWTI